MKKTYLSLAFLALLAALPLSASAMCPICTLAAAGGVELSRYLGIDDAVTGLWVGGLTVSLIMWTENYLDKKKINFRYRLQIDILAYVLLIFVPLYYMGIIGAPSHALSFFGLDKLLLGSIVGAAAFAFGGNWYEYLKAKNGDHAYFPFQKVVMPISPLILTSIVFYFLTK